MNSLTSAARCLRLVHYDNEFSGIDVKNLFTFFILVTFFTLFNVFFILSTFFIFKKRWQNRRVSKRKNGNEIIQFNNIIHFSFFPVTYGSVEFIGLQILKYCIQQTFLVF